MVGLPTMAASLFEFPADLGMIVDFTVEGDPQRAILVGHWLGRFFRKVNDREPAMTQTKTPIRRNVIAGTVRSAMGHHVPHAGEIGLGDTESTIREREHASDSAHNDPPNAERK